MYHAACKVEFQPFKRSYSEAADVFQLFITRVFAKVRFKKITSSKIVPKAKYLRYIFLKRAKMYFIEGRF